jgi:hypothetical protein
MHTFAAGVALAGLLSSPTAALEKAPGGQARPAPEFQGTETVHLSYYNTCTGWTWNWLGIPPLATYGVFFDDASPEPDRLIRTSLLFSKGSPPGYGFTAVVQVFPEFDPTCPGIPPLAQKLLLPQRGWNTIEWNGTDGIAVGAFWVLISHSPAAGNTASFVTEKGIAGGPEPGGCGTCYSPARETHSYQFGQESLIICPGAPWMDESSCNLELLWTSDVRTGPPLAVESTTWGQIKSLYR